MLYHLESVSAFRLVPFSSWFLMPETFLSAPRHALGDVSVSLFKLQFFVKKRDFPLLLPESPL